MDTTMKKTSKSPQKTNAVQVQKNPSFKSLEKTSVCTMPAKKAEPKSSSKKTIVRVHFDCGFPNTMYIRGEGMSSLSWDKGTPMKNISNNEWIWESSRPCSRVEFKVLINDEMYENGNNHSISYGDELSVTPNF